ncbi:hypothetical protein TWF718_002746 [Orbilia javanica]|uniref:Uncharacterized protein n=1 Tax=Orbilia javanica TaxID=47235 RepID=A0AAN8MNT2_9PEZI
MTPTKNEILLERRNGNCGGDKHSNRAHHPAPCSFTVILPTDMKCTGDYGPDIKNICIIRCQNQALNGPFGGCIAIQQVGLPEPSSSAPEPSATPSSSSSSAPEPSTTSSSSSSSAPEPSTTSSSSSSSAPEPSTTSSSSSSSAPEPKTENPPNPTTPSGTPKPDQPGTDEETKDEGYYGQEEEENVGYFKKFRFHRG